MLVLTKYDSCININLTDAGKTSIPIGGGGTCASLPRIGKADPGKHFRDELAADDLDILDAYHVLRNETIYQEPEPDIKTADWKYRMEGTDVEGKPLAVVFCFKDESTGFLITVFSLRR